MPMNPRLLVPRANFDADAAAYIRAVEIADTQPLEPGVKRAIDNFVRGCKKDGIWAAIKASCILAGARTLAGALVPLKGTAPTNNNFVAGDYNRLTGLIGNASNKTLDSGRNNNADPQDNFHMAVYASSSATAINQVYMGAGSATNETGASNFGTNAVGGLFFRNRASTAAAPALSTGLLGSSRSASASYQHRSGVTTTTATVASQTPHNANLFVFSATGSNFATNARFAFYSIGESLDLALLDTRVSALITAIGAS